MGIGGLLQLGQRKTVKRLTPHLFVLCVIGATAALGIHESLRTKLEDLRTSATQRTATGNVVLVAIDPHSLEKIGV